MSFLREEHLINESISVECIAEILINLIVEHGTILLGFRVSKGKTESCFETTLVAEPDENSLYIEFHTW